MLYNVPCSRLVGLALVLFATGCASLPEPQPIATGEPLSVREQTKTYTYTAKEKVGTVDHRDANGNTVGSSTVYADKKKVGEYTVWGSYQGDTRISDDELFAIAKDDDASREVRSSRERGVWMSRIGIGMAVVGALALGAGLYRFNTQKEGEDSPLTTGLMLGGGAGLSIGSVLSYFGSDKVKAEHPLEQSRAEAAADRYNRTLPAPKAGALGLK
jgi:hypothetical protein